MDTDKLIKEALLLALYGAQVVYGEQNPLIPLGGVNFWFEGDTMRYDVSPALWDHAAVTRDLRETMRKGLERAQAVELKTL